MSSAPPNATTRVYLDAGAVAPVRPEAVSAYLAALEDGWADPRRLHHEGRRARLVLDAAREAVAQCLAVHADEVLFTTSHREAVTAAVTGVAAASLHPGTVVHSAVETDAVIAAAALTPQGGTAVEVDRRGAVVPQALEEALRRRPGASLACVQSANGEVGTRQPLAAVAEVCRAHGVPLLVDAAAGIGHEPPPEHGDLLTGDARSWGSVPGVGLLVLRRGIRWVRTGPEHDGVERGPGEVSLPAVLAAAVTLQRATAELKDRDARLRPLVERIRSAAAAVPDTEVVGDAVDRLPHVLTFSCLYVDGEVLVEELDTLGFAVGSGSACTSSSLRPSHVLAAMQVLTHGNVRMGLHQGVTEEDVDRFSSVLAPAVARVRERLGVLGL
ncbi:MAG: aminotransferase class V-fold PLP-dependent enzyme [Kineosporiaceae bacterium]